MMRHPPSPAYPWFRRPGDRVDHQRPFGQRHAGQAAGHQAHLLSGKHIGRKSICRGDSPSSTKVGQVDSARVSWRYSWPDCQRRWRKASAPLWSNAADQHAVAPAPDLLDHHQLQIAQHVAQILRFPALPGGDIAEDRLFAEVKADHLRDVRIDRLSSATPVPMALASTTPPARRRTAAQDAEHRIGAEGQRVEPGVVDAAINHIHPPRPSVVRIYTAPFLINRSALHQLAPICCQEAVFEVGAVEATRVITTTQGSSTSELSRRVCRR